MGRERVEAKSDWDEGADNWDARILVPPEGPAPGDGLLAPDSCVDVGSLLSLRPLCLNFL